MTSVQSRRLLLNGSDMKVLNVHILIPNYFVSFVKNYLPLAVCLCFIFLTQQRSVYSQNETYQKSDSITVVDNKEFYYHIVAKGETAYSLSKLYETSLELLYENNPDAIYGLRLGEPLLIPIVSEKTVSKPTVNKKEDEELYIFHHVKKGETYYSIGQKYQVAVAAIRAANPTLTDILPENISLRIPHDQKTLSNIKAQQQIPEVGETVYIVRVGETLQSIAKTLNTTTAELIKANPNILQGLTDGDAINIPPAATPDKKVDMPKNYHVVKHGETIYSISKNYGVRIDSLLSNNRKIVNNHIVTGDTLTIPTYKHLYDFIEYRTDKKELLVDIANRFQISLSELKQRNPRLGNNIAKNEVVFIPVQKKTVDIVSDPSKPFTSAETIRSSAEGLLDLIKSKESVCIGGWDTKKKYTVALIMPFSANRLATALLSGTRKNTRPKIDSPSLKYLDFYQGVVLALDSLADKGLNICLNVYDITDAVQMNQLLEKPEMRKTDLIIGVISAEPFRKIADFSKQHGIPIVNVTSPRNDILQNYPNVAKIVPDERTIYQAAQRILPKDENFNILIVRKNDNAYSRSIENLKMLYPNHREFLSEGKSMSSALSLLDSFKPNFVFMFSENTPEVLDMMRIFDEKRRQYEITLIGYPRWNSIEKLDYNYAHNLRLHFITPQMVDYKEQSTKDFVYMFRARFNSDPSIMAFQGYDMAYNFIYSLGMFGNNCIECFNHVPHHFLSMGDVIFSTTPGNGYNNQYWSIYTVRDYEIFRITD